MAKATSTNALQFVYDPKQLNKILDANPDKVVFTITVQEEVTKSGRKVGALNIMAKGTFKGKQPRDGGEPGCPVPPCMTH